MNEACPCGSGLGFEACCGPYLNRVVPAPDPEALMRSRYSAYVRGDAAYLRATWAAASRPAQLPLDPVSPWRGLRVLDAQQQGDRGEVEFIARYQHAGRLWCLRERSRFQRLDGRWYYLDGDSRQYPEPAPGRNQPCPCGSGRKYKHCCGA